MTSATTDDDYHEGLEATEAALADLYAALETR